MAELQVTPPENCPGTESDQAGKAGACQGCPNQSICSSGLPKAPDPAIEEVRKRMLSVKHKILVLSGKGGVGKSTIAAHLAHGLAEDDTKQVALLDIDICGPSVPKIMGCEGEQVHQSASGWSPVYVEDNVAVMSVGFLLASPSDAVIWRGPKKNGLIKQFLKDVDWGDVDYLIIDTPPGTSDEHLSIVQYLGSSRVEGAVIVTTPQEVALLDVRKEINFCRKVNLPIIGIIENMSVFVCPKCKRESKIFPPTTGGGSKLAVDSGVPFLGSVPLDPRIGRCCDRGQSFLREVPDSPAALAYKEIVSKIIQVCKTSENTDPVEIRKEGLVRKREYSTSGEKVILVPYQRKFVERYHNWMQSAEILQLTASEPLSLEQEYKMQADWMNDTEKVTFIILSKDLYQQTGDELESMVGDVNLFFNDFKDPFNAELDVMIPDVVQRGKGFASEAVQLMMCYATTELEVRRLTVKIGKQNVSSLTLFQKKFGFSEISRSDVFNEITLQLTATSDQPKRKVRWIKVQDAKNSNKV